MRVQELIYKLHLEAKTTNDQNLKTMLYQAAEGLRLTKDLTKIASLLADEKARAGTPIAEEEDENKRMWPVNEQIIGMAIDHLEEAKRTGLIDNV